MTSGNGTRFKYRFKELGKYEARLRGNEPHVTLSVLAGPGDNLTYCGTLTMSEAEWDTLKGHLSRTLSEDFEVEER
jgi:hypothetical protein